MALGSLHLAAQDVDCAEELHVAAGVDVVDIGMVATPMSYFAAHHLGTGSAVSVTAPYERWVPSAVTLAASPSTISSGIS